MTVSRSAASYTMLLLAGLLGGSLSACSQPAPAATSVSTQAAAPAIAGVTPVGIAAPGSAAPGATAGYSCSFPGPAGHAILARFTVDSAGAHDDQGLPFTVLTSSPTALVLAHARDDSNVAPNGDIGAYVVAIDRRSLSMVQTTVGLNGPDATRRGHCIAG